MGNIGIGGRDKGQGCLYRNSKENGNYRDYWGHIGVIGGIYMDYIGIIDEAYRDCIHGVQLGRGVRKSGVPFWPLLREIPVDTLSVVGGGGGFPQITGPLTLPIIRVVVRIMEFGGLYWCPTQTP